MADSLRPRASPIVDPAVEELLRRPDELAKRWAIALILARPLGEIGDAPLEQLAREAPAVCSGVLNAIYSEVELARLTGVARAGAREDPAPACRIAAIAGARDARATAEAVEALRGVLWEALLDELGRSLSDRPVAGLAAGVGDRLAYVCAAALAAALDAAFGSQEHQPPHEPTRTAADAPESIVDASRPASPAGGRAVIVDELAGGGGLDRGSPPQDSTPAVLGDRPVEAEIAIRDQRVEEGPAAWVGTIGAQLQRFAVDGLPFAVLLVELAEIERLRDQGPARELSRLTGQVEDVLASAIGQGGVVLTRERPGRYWLLATDTDRAGAGDLADRLASAVRSAVSHRGVALEVAVGAAVCPEDGREPATLAAYADVGLFAARAAIRAAATRAGAPANESGRER